MTVNTEEIKTKLALLFLHNTIIIITIHLRIKRKCETYHDDVTRNIN